MRVCVCMWSQDFPVMHLMRNFFLEKFHNKKFSLKVHYVKRCVCVCVCVCVCRANFLPDTTQLRERQSTRGHIYIYIYIYFAIRVTLTFEQIFCIYIYIYTNFLLPGLICVTCIVSRRGDGGKWVWTKKTSLKAEPKSWRAVNYHMQTSQNLAAEEKNSTSQKVSL